MSAIRHSLHAQSSPFCVLPCSTMLSQKFRSSWPEVYRDRDRVAFGSPSQPCGPRTFFNERRRRCPTKRHITTGCRCVPKIPGQKRRKILENHLHPPTWRLRPVRPRNNLPTGAGAGCAPQGSGTFLGPGAETVWGAGPPGGEAAEGVCGGAGIGVVRSQISVGLIDVNMCRTGRRRSVRPKLLVKLLLALFFGRWRVSACGRAHTTETAAADAAARRGRHQPQTGLTWAGGTLRDRPSLDFTLGWLAQNLT